MRPERNVSVQTRCDRREMRSLSSELLRLRTQWMQVRKTMNQLGIKKVLFTALGDLDITTPAYVVCGKIMFSVMFVYLFAGVTTTHYAIGHSQALPHHMDLFNLVHLGLLPFSSPSCSHSRRLPLNILHFHEQIGKDQRKTQMQTLRVNVSLF